MSASLALEWVQTPVSRKSHSSVFISQVTLNNVEVCSENISTLKKTLEVWRKWPISFQQLQPLWACRWGESCALVLVGTVHSLSS